MSGPGASVLEGVQRRDRLLLGAVLAAIIALAWTWLLTGAGTGMSPLAMHGEGEMSGMPGMADMVMRPVGVDSRLCPDDVPDVVDHDGGDDAAERDPDAAALRPHQPRRAAGRPALRVGIVRGALLLAGACARNGLRRD